MCDSNKLEMVNAAKQVDHAPRGEFQKVTSAEEPLRLGH